MRNIIDNSAKLLTIAAILTWPSSASAEDDKPIAVSPRVETTARGPIDSPERISSLGYRDVTVDAQIASEDGSLVGNFSVDFAFASKPTTERSNRGTLVTSSFTNISIRASAPLNSSEPGSTIDFKGFGDEGKLTLNFNHFEPRYSSPVTDYDLTFRFARTCMQEAGQEWVKEGLGEQAFHRKASVDRLLTSYDNLVKPGGVLIDTMDSTFKAEAEAIIEDQQKGRTALEAFAPTARKACYPIAGNDVRNEAELGTLYAKKALSPDEYRRWREDNVTNGRVFYYGAEVSLGYNRFPIVNGTTYSVDRIDRVGFDANARAGFIFPGAGLQISVGGGYVRSFKPLSETEICSPPSPSGSTTCATGQSGLPEQSDSGYAEVAARKVLVRREDGSPMIAIAPRVTYIFEDDAVQVRVPVFLQRNDKGGLDGGIQAIWRSDTGKFAVGAFVGVPFWGL